ncbi:MAG: S41 family peptidase, partial [Bacteroidota bacterium]
MKNKTIYPIIGAILIVIGIVLGIGLSRNEVINSNDEGGRFERKLADILQTVENKYVDSVNTEKLFEETIADLLHSLDPHSNYISAKQASRFTESIEGKFGGVGVRFAIMDDTLNVTHVISGAQASQAGLQKFDQIIAVNDSTIANIGLTNKRVQELLKGPEDTDVAVTILRKKDTLEKTITRGSVPIESVSAAYMMGADIGYIRLNQFSMTSVSEFYQAALELRSQGMNKLIFDLRYNGGGVMGSAIGIADALLEKGKPIVSTKGRTTPEETFYSENEPFLGDVDLTVLINESSASASEIVAGAIQDNDRGTIIGRRSFGKGLVQQDTDLKDGSKLRLTVSRYYTPTGRCIQKPYTDDYKEYMMDEMNRYERGEMYSVDSSELNDSLKYTTPEGKVVYGGGGIMPDIFVPLDTTGSSPYFRRLRYSG